MTTLNTASNKFKLGTPVMDPVTGLKGIAYLRTYMQSGCIQIHLQPKAKDNKPEDGLFIDESLLVLIEDESIPDVSHLSSPPDPNFNLEMGAQYRDTITKFVGIATEIVECFNGCILVKLEGEKEQDILKNNVLRVDWKRLEKIGNGVAEKTVPASTQNTGAAMRRAERY